MSPSKRGAHDAPGLLATLLRTPKTRQALTACVASKGLTSKYVDGWLIERCQSGYVTKTPGLQPGRELYQVSEYAIFEAPAESVYPRWLDPRVLPAEVACRRVYVCGLDTSGSAFTAFEQMERNNDDETDH